MIARNILGGSRIGCRRRTFGFPGLTAFLLVACSFGIHSALAQEHDQQAENRITQILTVPAPLAATDPQLRPTGEVEISNIVRGGLNLGAIYDDNAATVGGTSSSGYQYSISPNLALQQTRPDTTLNLDYHGGLTITHQPFASNLLLQSTTSATAGFQHLFGRRLLLALQNQYLLTNDPFSYSINEVALPGAGQLNPTIPASATRTTSLSTGSLTFQLTRHSSMGISGGYSSGRYRQVEVVSGIAQSLIDTRTATGRWFYVVEVSRRQKLGIEYQLQDMRFDGSVARTMDQTGFLFDEISFTPDLTLILFAGPDCAHTHNNVLMFGSNTAKSVVPGINDQWSPAGGAMFTWRGKLAALRLSGQRRVSDGSGFAGSVRETAGTAELRKDFTRAWSASLGYSYSVDRLLAVPASTANAEITLQQGTVGIERRISKDVSVRAQYARVMQISSGTPALLTAGTHNRVEVVLLFQFTRPWR